MITTWIILKDNKILRSCEARTEKEVIATAKFFGVTDYDEIRNTKQNNSVTKGKDIREYDSNYILRPEIDRIIDGLIEAPKGKKLNAEKTELIDKTVKEKIDDGEIELSEYEIYDEETEQVRGKKFSELYASKLLTLEDYINNYVKPQRDYQLDWVDLKKCNALNLVKMSEAKKTEWEVYKQALRDLPENVKEVKDDVTELFPVMPE